MKKKKFQHKRTAPKLSFQCSHTYIVYWLLACRDLKTESAFFQSGQSKNFQTLLCIMVKSKKPHVKVLTNRFLFEWSHRRILSTDVKVRTTVQNSNIHSGPSEYVKFNKIQK